MFSEFDLTGEIAKFELRKPWRGGMESTVLVKVRDMRVVLFAMDEGRKMNEHHAAGTVSVHVLRGGVRLRVGEEEVRLGMGGLLIIGAGVRHDVEALEESVFLLTIGAGSQVVAKI